VADHFLAADDLELRRAARERALELLYEGEIKNLTAADLVASLVLPPDDLTMELISGVEAHRAEIDRILERRVAPRWSVTRLAAVDRAVLRLGTYELAEVSHRPRAVIINEAVVLARRFGTDDSPRFVNGVLSAIAAEVRPADDPGERAAPPERRQRLVDAVVCDLDGVIRHWDNEAVAAADRALGLEPGTLATAAFDPELLDRQMRGQITAEQWLEETAARVGATHPIDRAEAARLLLGVGWSIDHTVLDLLDEARRQVPVVLLSNASTRLRGDLAISGIDDRFDAVISSAELGFVKPEPEAYQAAADAAGVALDRCLMIDDREENVVGAEAVGMRGALFTEVDALAQALEATGLTAADPAGDADRDGDGDPGS
jgi:putative hydrolase of the HAD superfamily